MKKEIFETSYGLRGEVAVKTAEELDKLAGAGTSETLFKIRCEQIRERARIDGRFSEEFIERNILDLANRGTFHEVLQAEWVKHSAAQKHAQASTEAPASEQPGHEAQSSQEAPESVPAVPGDQKARELWARYQSADAVTQAEMRRDDFENLTEAARIVSNDAPASNPSERQASELWERYEKADATTRAEMRRDDFENLTEAARIVSHGVRPAALKPAPARSQAARIVSHSVGPAALKMAPAREARESAKVGMSVAKARQLTARYQGAPPTIQAIMRRTQGDQLTEAVHVVTKSGAPITEEEKTDAQASMRSECADLLQEYASLPVDEKNLFRKQHAADLELASALT